MFLTDDLSLPALTNSFLLAKNCNALQVEIALYEGAGHLIEPPSPHCSCSFNALLGGAIVVFGGSDVHNHALARRDAWKKLLDFFATNKSKL